MAQKIPRNRLYNSPSEIIKSFLLSLSPWASPGGDHVPEFERAFRAYVGSRHAIAVSSGTSALLLSLRALGAAPGDKVIVSDFNVPEVPALLLSLGLSPVLIDIDPRTYNIDTGLIERHIDKKVKFLLITHMFGTPVRMDKVKSIADKHNLVFIEDACQAVGASYQNKKAGVFGDVGFFSFGSLKVCSAFGGGMIVTDNDGVAQKIRSEIHAYPCVQRRAVIREIVRASFIRFATQRAIFTYVTYPVLRMLDACDQAAKFNLFKGSEISSFKQGQLHLFQKKLSGAQAWAGTKQIKVIDGIIARINENALLLNRSMAAFGVGFQQVPAESQSAYFKYVIDLDNREKVLDHLFRSGIDATYGYMRSCSAIKAFAAYSTGCPESVRLEERHIYLPIHSLGSDKDLAFLVETLRIALEQ